MQFFILILLICFFVFLYCIYLLSNDDFIFLRRDITTEKLFNHVFLGSLLSLFTARLFYGLFYVKSIFTNPLVFLLFPYFPGLSLLGGVVGVGAYFLFLTTRKKDLLPLGRISDFVSIAFLISLPVGFIGYFILSEKGASVVSLAVQSILYFILFIIFLKFLLPRLLSGKFKEWTITLVFLACFSLINLFSNAFAKITLLNYFKNPENIILTAILLISIGALFRHEGLLLKIRQFKKGK